MIIIINIIIIIILAVASRFDSRRRLEIFFFTSASRQLYVLPLLLYECEIPCLPMEKQILRAYEANILRRVFGTKEEKVRTLKETT
jgi:hypothetical protein